MTNAELFKVVDHQENTINQVTGRVSQLADELTILKNEIDTFKNLVAKDMRRLLKTVQLKK